jgi:peptidoglycan/xylan/chitin deacetylase (PgdA/CDA1 family)
VVRQVGGGAAFLESVDGVWPQFLRAPFGVVTPVVLRVARTLHLRVLGWTVDSSDYLESPPEDIVARTMSQVRPGAVVLLHDGGGDRASTVAALRPLIQALKAQGYSFTTPALQPAVV